MIRTTQLRGTKLDEQATIGGGAASDDDSGCPIVLLCFEARLRRLLRFALTADGYQVLDGQPGAPIPEQTRAVVVDLDSLRWRPAVALARLQASGLAPGTAVVLISVYPTELDGLASVRRLALLQPPFAPHELTRQLAGLLGRPPGPLDWRSPGVLAHE